MYVGWKSRKKGGHMGPPLQMFIFDRCLELRHEPPRRHNS